ncbi:hypothetical protein P7C70_g1411, partial [Phenoliferia sp. Uapishka_3]
MQQQPPPGFFATDVHMRRLMAELELERKRESGAGGSPTGSTSQVPEGTHAESAPHHCPTPPPNGICPLQWLAPELLDYILALVADDDRASMRETCLVARSWHKGSVTQLWKELFSLPMDDMLEEILQTPSLLETYTTEEVVFQGSLFDRQIPDRSPLVAELVPRLNGVRKMQLAEYANFDARVFLSSSLNDLTNLSINHTMFQPLSAPLPLTFRLSRLEITGDTAFPAHLITSLLTPSISTLKTLAFNLSARLPAFSAFINLFPSFASSLSRLELSSPYPTLLPLLTHCTSLSSIRLSSSVHSTALRTIFTTIPSRLSTLELELNLDEWEKGRPWKPCEARDTLVVLLDLVDENCVALRELKMLVLALEGFKDTEVDALGEMEEFRQKCKERGVEIVVDGEARDGYNY